jgi:hypothetical protein
MDKKKTRSNAGNVILITFEQIEIKILAFHRFLARQSVILMHSSKVAIEFSIGYESHPFSVVVVVDFKDDKKLDFAVANYGTDNLEIHLQTC